MLKSATVGMVTLKGVKKQTYLPCSEVPGAHFICASGAQGITPQGSEIRALRRWCWEWHVESPLPVIDFCLCIIVCHTRRKKWGVCVCEDTGKSALKLLSESPNNT